MGNDTSYLAVPNNPGLMRLPDQAFVFWHIHRQLQYTVGHTLERKSVNDRTLQHTFLIDTHECVILSSNFSSGVDDSLAEVTLNMSSVSATAKPLEHFISDRTGVREQGPVEC